MQAHKINWIKFTVGLLACLLIRLIPWRAPNVEPILATGMPFARAYGALTGFLFPFLSIIFYDLLTKTFGSWTFFTSFAYGLVGLGAALYFKGRQGRNADYVWFAIAGTLFFDAITGLTTGPIFFHQNFLSALMGQIPFTLWHLLGNVSFALVLSPAIYELVVQNKKLEAVTFVNILNPKNLIP